MMKFFFNRLKVNRGAFSWRPFIVLGLVLLVAGILQVYMWLKPPVVPTANVPVVTWEEVQNPPEETVPPPSDTGTPTVPSSEPAEDVPVAPTPDVTEDEVPDQVPEVPSVINLAVPFTSQAPFGIWDAVTEETCEEASFLMVREYYAGNTAKKLLASDADTHMRAAVSAEESLGLGVSISAQEMQDFYEGYAGATLRIVENPSIVDLQALLAQGHPIIVPAYGRMLGNPFFTGEGPLYHMLVLRGYTETTFISNDPGTQHGEGYQYAYDVLMAAIGDWDGDSPDGGKRVLVYVP